MDDDARVSLKADNDRDDEALAAMLDRLTAEHGLLEEKLAALRGSESLADLNIQRLKKRKLMLKDQIFRLKALLTPDIIA